MVRLQSVAVSTQPFPPSPFELAAEAAAAAENMTTAASALLPGPAGGALGAVGDAVATVDSVVDEVGSALGQKVPFEVYEHHGPFLFPKWAFAADEAPRILRQKRRRASIGEGEGGCSDASPGHRFALADHPAPQLDAPYVLTRVEHRGELHPKEGAWRVYWNTFECVPAEMTYVPPRPKRKSVQVTLTAMVVGPSSEEIYVDEKGQIKVQFHWDRDGKYDENSSCWIRVMQPWGGAGWGVQFIPRVGMEVVVGFEGGDPDKPMVLGSLYNGTHPSPFQLPGDKTRSGWRTQSSLGGNGYNELSFEDRAGDEEVHLHAQRNLREVVRNDHSTGVGHDRTLQVGRHLAEDVRGRAHGDHPPGRHPGGARGPEPHRRRPRRHRRARQPQLDRGQQGQAEPARPVRLGRGQRRERGRHHPPLRRQLDQHLRQGDRHPRPVGGPHRRRGEGFRQGPLAHPRRRRRDPQQEGADLRQQGQPRARGRGPARRGEDQPQLPGQPRPARTTPRRPRSSRSPSSSRTRSSSPTPARTTRWSPGGGSTRAPPAATGPSPSRSPPRPRPRG